MSLADRIEKLDGPHRGADREIGIKILGWTPRAGGDYLLPDGSVRSINFLPYYTADMHAAMTLLLEGFTFTVSQQDDGKGVASIYRRNTDGEKVTCCRLTVAATPALALCAAAIRARQEQAGE